MLARTHSRWQLILVLVAIIIGFCNCSDVESGRKLTDAAPVPSLPPKLLNTDGTVDCEREFGDPASSLFVLPYRPGSNIRLIQGYCDQQGSHFDRFAIDFGMGFLDTVIAARTGVIRRVIQHFADNDYTYGHHNYVYVEHRDGSLAFYAHLSPLSVVKAVGDTVHQGERLALNGSSGMPFHYPCLHFEVWYDDSPYDISNSVPVNFRNAEGDLNEQNGLRGRGAWYRALPFTPNDL